MNRVLSFDYNQSYIPSAPFLPITIDGYESIKQSVTLSAFVDSGADGTMIPYPILQAVGAEYEDTVILRGTTGVAQRRDRYTVRIRIGNEIIHAISAVAIAAGSEPLIGRDVLNHLVVTLNGHASVTEIQID
jgi:gag-polyprotein putative aspartyl protease